MKSPYERYIKIAVITVAIAYGINLLYGLTPAGGGGGLTTPTPGGPPGAPTVLLINIHIAAGDAGRHVFFPEAHEANYTNRYAALLYDCSSEMPAVFNEAIREAKGPAAAPPFRGMSYNASAAQLVTMLNIGSISVKTE